MEKIIQIWNYLANKFNNECLADEILSFSVEMRCDFNDFENFASYPFMISFPGLVVCLTDSNWRTQFENCLSMKFICNLDVSFMQIRHKGAIAIAEALITNSTLQQINLRNNQIRDKGTKALAKALKTNSTL
jgi:hypothetical protein